MAPRSSRRGQQLESCPVTTYKVYRSMDYSTSWDSAWHDQSEFRVLQGTYKTLAQANRAAERNLLEEWSRDSFDEEYTVVVQDGRVKVHAVGMEGTTFDVEVVECNAERV